MPKINKKNDNTSGPKLVHPNSRKALKIARKNIRANHIDKKKEERDMKLAITAQKLLWFKDNIKCNDSTCTPDQVVDIINRYIHRFNEELEQIEIINGIKGRKKQQHLSRKNTIDHSVERERKQFEESGIYIPDLLSKKGFSSLKVWDGSPHTSVNVKQIKVTKSTLERYNSKISENTETMEINENEMLDSS